MMNPTWSSYWQILSRPPPTEFFVLLYQKTAPHRNPLTDFFLNFFLHFKAHYLHKIHFLLQPNKDAVCQ